MRRAVAEATHHAAHRSVFGRLLAEQPLHRNVLADLCLDSEAATATALRLARVGRRGRPAVPPARDGSREVLGLQDDADARRGGARMPRRQRLRRGVRPAAALPREPAQLAVGGRRERERLGSAPSCGARARERGGAARGDRLRSRGQRTSRRCRADARSRARGSRRSSSTGRGESWSSRRSASRRSLLVRHAPAEVADAFCATRLGGRGGPRLRHASDRGGRRCRHRSAHTSLECSRVECARCRSRSSTARPETATTPGPRVSRPRSRRERARRRSRRPA